MTQPLPPNAIAGPVGPLLPTETFNGIAFVGEAPGRHEVIRRKPFVGPAGREFDRILGLLSINRRASLIANVFRWQPTWSASPEGKRRENDVSLFFAADPNDGDSRWPPLRSRLVLKPYAADLEALFACLSTHDPKKIIVLGATALWALTGETSMRETRGKPVASSFLGKTVYPTFHPAYALHRNDPAISDQIVADIAAALA